MPADSLAPFHPAVREWFRSALGEPTRVQSLAFGPISRGESSLVLAPTGSGKTLAAFLAALDVLVYAREPPKDARCRVLYVSPLKALAIDVERNLRAPLAGIVETARRRGETVRVPTVAVRSGDTTAAERARMIRTPPDVLITTPESLYLILTSAARDILAHIETVIIDEIHALVPSKRGAHLFLSLERLEDVLRARTNAKTKTRLQRIGLSATQKPLDEVARLLGGLERGKPRPVTIVDAGEKKKLDITIEVPEVDMGRLGELEDTDDPLPGEGPRRTIWPHVHARLVELVRAHRSTILFVNSRRLAERLASAINELAGEEIALAHHGSVAREKRALIEDRLKRGTLPAIVATSSLELGIDMGAVDLVVQIEAPPSVASGMQRIGRASHGVGGVPKGIVMPKHRADLLASAAAAAGMRAGAIEETFYLRNPLDVLAQHVVAIAAMEPITVSALFDLVRRAAPFAELPRASFEGVLDMLSGRYPSEEFHDLRARVTWNRARGTITAREGAKRLAVVNAGTIPDRGLYGVFLRGGDEGERDNSSKRVGELDEEMVFESREGEVFLLGASSWRIDEITRDRVIVTPAAGEPGKMPFWKADRMGRPRGFGETVGALTRQIARASDADARRMLEDDLRLDPSAAKNLVAYVHEQREATGEVPSDKAIVVERFRDELGDWRVCILSPFGARVHAPWSTAVLSRLTQNEAHGADVESIWSDDGIAFRLPASETPPDTAQFFPASGEVERMVTDALGSTSLFAARFREAAARALLLPRRAPGKRTPLWAQRKRAYDLLAVASQYPSFPIVLEAYRECLRDVFDLPSLALTLRRVEQRKIRVTTCDARIPSPFASSLLFGWVASFLYDGDAPLAERRAQALTIDHAQLRELLGETELRRLLDVEAIEAHVAALQRFTHPVKHADGVHDLLLSLGDLSPAEIEARSEPKEGAATWTRALERERRIVRAKVAGEARLIAAEDVARYRDALGVVPPQGMPSAFLEPVKDPLGDLVARYARTHGPFVAGDLEARFGAGPPALEATIAKLVRAGKLVEGAFLPHGRGIELCDAEVLRALRRKSLAKLRKQVEPVDAAAYGRFLLEWHALPSRRRGQDALVETIAQLQGCPLVVSELDTRILPARVDGFRAWDLDALCASGRVTWAGVEPLGPSDGRIALYLADDEALLSPKPHRAEGELAGKVRAELEKRGAIFFHEIARVVGGYPAEVLDALWTLVWSGEATNDTLEPLRSLLDASSRAKDRSGGRPRRARRVSHDVLPGSEGRWSLRMGRLGAGDEPKPTERATALAGTLLDRYGVLTREAVHAEGIEGGFSAVYEVLKAMEDAGRVRRGYFLAGRGATQFALPGADDRLRAVRDASEAPSAVVLAATDPANPYGASLPWPAREDDADESRRPQRAAGALVVLYDGALVGWLARGHESLLTFLPRDEGVRAEAAAALANALAGLVIAGTRRALLLVTIDGRPASESALGEALADAGFGASREGWQRRRDVGTPFVRDGETLA